MQIFVATSRWVIGLIQAFWFLKYLKYRIIAEIYLGSPAVVQSQGDVVDGQGVPGRLCVSCGVLHTSLPSMCSHSGWQALFSNDTFLRELRLPHSTLSLVPTFRGSTCMTAPEAQHAWLLPRLNTHGC